jgi:TetR/AcrR family transcriptional regulator, cholesterol catabolism regulator
MTDTAARPVIVPDGRTRRGEETRERLLAAAIQLFGSQGFESTSMKELAAAAGVRAPAIYNHFESKESILAAATIWAMEDFHAQVVRTDNPAADARDRLANLVCRHVIYQLEHVQLARSNDLVMDADALRQLLPADAHTHVRQLMRKHLDLITGIIAELQQARLASPPLPPPRLCALAVLTMCDRVLSWYKPDGALSKEEIAAAYWELVRGMLRLQRRPPGGCPQSR